MRKIKFERLSGQLDEVAYQLRKVHFSKFCPPKAWQPNINAFRLRDAIQICVDLAGVDKSAIDLRVDHGRLLIRGERYPSDPIGSDAPPEQILAMEIDHGPFERQVDLPLEVDPERVTAEQRNGMLWIHLPLRAPA
jgi:HSP20 family protein